MEKHVPNTNTVFGTTWGLGTCSDSSWMWLCGVHALPIQHPQLALYMNLSRHVQAFHMFLSSSPAFTARAAAVVLLLADPAPGEAFEKRIQEAADFQHQCREMVVAAAGDGAPNKFGEDQQREI